MNVPRDSPSRWLADSIRQPVNPRPPTTPCARPCRNGCDSRLAAVATSRPPCEPAISREPPRPPRSWLAKLARSPQRNAPRRPKTSNDSQTLWAPWRVVPTDRALGLRLHRRPSRPTASCRRHPKVNRRRHPPRQRIVPRRPPRPPRDPMRRRSGPRRTIRLQPAKLPRPSRPSSRSVTWQTRQRKSCVSRRSLPPGTLHLRRPLAPASGPPHRVQSGRATSRRLLSPPPVAKAIPAVARPNRATRSRQAVIPSHPPPQPVQEPPPPSPPRSKAPPARLSPTAQTPRNRPAPAARAAAPPRHPSE